jgi:hypothetical protein
MEMLRGVLVFGGIAAAHVSADQAQAQVYPCVAHFQAFFAAARVWLDVPNLIHVRACCHALSPLAQSGGISQAPAPY